MIGIFKNLIFLTFILIINSNYLLDNYTQYQYLFYGFIFYPLSTLIIKPKKYIFWDTFFHEISHIIFALLTFAKPHKLMVSPENPEDGANGYVAYTYKSSRFMDGVRGYFVSLAPYFFSPLAFVFFCIYWIIVPLDGFVMDGITTSQVTVSIILFCAGFFYAYNIRTSFIQAKPYQSDFDSVGYKNGMFFVIFMQLFFLLFYSLILFSNHDSFTFIYEYIVEMIQNFDYEDLIFYIRIFLYEEFDIWI